MGEVYRSRDPALGRDLAVKILKPALRGDPDAERRFVAEAQTLGRLQHPNIVPVYNLGRLPDGRLFFTMKVVEGRTLGELVRARSDLGSPRTDFVHVFLQVCQALAFAHDRGVIHRDLKPANVMVDARGEVQVMDWGLAKSPTDATAGANTLADPGESIAAADDRTRPGRRMGTWAYMPPELARGDVAEASRRSDVFGLGTILCEILTGQPPYTGPDAAVRQQATEARLDAAVARLRASGADPELVRLAERCLAPDPAERPADAGAVAAAMTAYRAGVEERLAQERLERERQQVAAAEARRRQRVWMALAAVVAVAVAGLAAVLFAIDNLRSQELTARRLAEEREGVAREALDEVFSKVVDDWAARQPELTTSHDAVLDRALALYEQLNRATPEKPEGRAVLAEAYRRAGSLRHRLTRAPVAEEHYRKALQLYESLRGEFPEDSRYGPQVAGCRNDLGTVLAAHDRRVEAGAEFDAVGDLCRAADGGQRTPELRREEAAAHLNRALMLSRQTDGRKRAIAEFDTSTRLYDVLLATDRGKADYLFGLATGLHRRGGVLRLSGRRHDAVKSCNPAMKYYAELVESHPHIPRYRQGQASNLNLLVRLQWELNIDRLEEAHRYAEQARTISERLARDFPSLVEVQIGLGETYLNLAYLHHAAKELNEEAILNWYDRAAAQFEPVFAKNSKLVEVADHLRNTYWGRAAALHRLGRAAKADPDWERALAFDNRDRRLVLVSLRASSNGEHRQAVAAAAECVKLKNLTDNNVYDCATVYARAADAEPPNSLLREQYAATAVGLLWKATKDHGYVNVARLKRDSYLNSLRGREAFERLIVTMEDEVHRR
jgi:tetratricopeptide (TPR) repeat protein